MDIKTAIAAERRELARMLEDLPPAIQDNAHHPWKPPVGGSTAALGHDVIHGLDITVALGIDRRVQEDGLRPLLEAVTPRIAAFFGGQASDRYVAT
ncbi:hypothetical protein ACIBO5_50905 [Nonomuraea angiospora]|uniref:hypothetical protein n=1 Tax=Nonomuraea angiospora TaxID=46172 RepID=UPI0037AE0E94